MYVLEPEVYYGWAEVYGFLRHDWRNVARDGLQYREYNLGSGML